MNKLIFLDIDGTLVEPGTNVPPDSALEAIHRARKAGNFVFPCSGRNYGMVSPLLQYGFDGVVASAGGYIEYDGNVLFDCPMTPEQQERVLTVFQESGIYRTIESRCHAYTDDGLKEFLRESRAAGNSELLRWQELLENNLGIRPLSEYRGEALYKVVFMSPDSEHLQKPQELLGDEFNFCIQDGDPLGLINGELINKAFNKGTAVQKLSEYLNIPIANTVAFGDSMNDLEMLEAAGLGICMGNGCAKLQSIADEVCPPLLEDGLYKTFAAHGLM